VRVSKVSVRWTFRTYGKFPVLFSSDREELQRTA